MPIPRHDDRINKAHTAGGERALDGIDAELEKCRDILRRK